jgi:hypothetical protein
MIDGRGDHMLDYLSHALQMLPWFATVGIRETPIRALAIEDLVVALRTALIDPLPPDLAPRRPFSPEQFRAGLPDPGPFGLRDLGCCA